MADTKRPECAEAHWLFAHHVWNAGLLLAECVGSGWWWERLSDGKADMIDQAGEDHAYGAAGTSRAPESITSASAPFTKSLNAYAPSASISAPKCVSRTRTTNWAVAGEKVLELGAGTGLAGLCAARSGARSVVLTDYPTPEILATLDANVRSNSFVLCKPKDGAKAGCANQEPGKMTGEVADNKAEILTEVTVFGHEWGTFSSPWCGAHRSTFTRILAADTLWLDGAHAPQAASMAFFLAHSTSACVWIFAGFHTGREKVRRFLEETLPKVGLRVRDAWEVDIAGMERHWDGTRHEGPGEGARWSVIAIAGWNQTALARFIHEESS